jgi:hypothetical protein
MRLAVRCAIAVFALAAVQAAPAAGPDLGTTEALLAGEVSYAVGRDGAATSLTARSGSGDVLRTASVKGVWGIPRVTLAGAAGGLSHDGRRLVLAEATHPNKPLRDTTRFLVVDTRRLAVLHTVKLKGDFGYDALSPNGRTLYLIQHMPGGNLTRYRVRAFDLQDGKLLPKPIADTRQKGWLMNGYPAARTASANGRWVYTLYANPDNYPFVHALDSVTKTAVCIGLPWKWSGNMSEIETATMKLSDGDAKLTIAGAGGDGPKFVLDTRKFRLL